MSNKARQGRTANEPFLVQFPDGSERDVPRAQAGAYLGCERIIRIRDDEFSALPAAGPFTHFNLQHSDHEPGALHALTRIVRPGWYRGENDERRPLLDFFSAKMARCLTVRQNLAYEELTDRDFEHSFPHAKNASQLLETMIRRYSESMPNLSRSEIIRLGVSRSCLEILSKKSG